MAAYFQVKLIKPLGPPGYGPDYRISLIRRCRYYFSLLIFLRLLFEDGVYLAQSFHVCGYYLRVATIRGQRLFDGINSYNAI